MEELEEGIYTRFTASMQLPEYACESSASSASEVQKLAAYSLTSTLGTR